MTIYDIFFLIFSLIYLPYLIIKGKAHKDFAERFGKLPAVFSQVRASGPVWIHAVSVGEVIAVKNFVQKFSENFPGRKIVLSTTTKTGRDVAEKLFSRSMPKFYFPLDFSWIVRRAVNRINPSLLIMMETEIWPNLITELSKKKRPIALINGRLSEKSYRGYKRISFLFSRILKKITLFCMQSPGDAERIKSLGAPEQAVKITGNMKFDITPPPPLTEPPYQPRRLVNNHLPTYAVGKAVPELEGKEVIVAGSTHKGEEEIILDAYRELAGEFADLRLLIAPRHVDRAESIKKLAEQAGFKAVFLSNRLTDRVGPLVVETANGPTRSVRRLVYILDTHGELGGLYKLASIVIMGGSFIKRGGHNIIEPAVFGKAILFGPFMFNFRDMAKTFTENSAAIQLKDKNLLCENLKKLLKDKPRRELLGKNARELIREGKGATERNVREMEKILGCFGTTDKGVL